MNEGLYSNLPSTGKASVGTRVEGGPNWGIGGDAFPLDAVQQLAVSKVLEQIPCVDEEATAIDG